MSERHPVAVGCVLGLLGTVAITVVLGRWFPGVTAPLPGFLPPELRESAVLNQALVAATFGPGLGAFYAGYASARGHVRGAVGGYVVSLVTVWLSTTAVPGGFLLATAASALVAGRPTELLVYLVGLSLVALGGLLLALVLAVLGCVWGAVGASARMGVETSWREQRRAG